MSIVDTACQSLTGSDIVDSNLRVRLSVQTPSTKPIKNSSHPNNPGGSNSSHQESILLTQSAFLRPVPIPISSTSTPGTHASYRLTLRILEEWSCSTTLTLHLRSILLLTGRRPNCTNQQAVTLDNKNNRESEEGKWAEKEGTGAGRTGSRTIWCSITLLHFVWWSIPRCRLVVLSRRSLARWRCIPSSASSISTAIPTTTRISTWVSCVRAGGWRWWRMIRSWTEGVVANKIES